eukprot:755157-Hanusia_phi.AAC.1
MIGGSYKLQLQLLVLIILRSLHTARVDGSPSRGQLGLLGRSQAAALQAYRVLIKNGADAKAKSESGRTPLDAAAFKGHNHVVEVFRE